MTKYQLLQELICFTRQDILEISNSNKHADTIIYRLKNKQLLTSIKRNLYTINDPQTKKPLADPFLIGSKITSSSFLSHLTALAYYRLINYNEPIVFVTSLTRFRDFSFNDYRYHFLTGATNFGVVSINQIRVSDLERTILDCLKDFNKTSGFIYIIEAITKITILDQSRLVTYLQEYNNKFLYQKVGYLLSFFKPFLNLSDDFINWCLKNTGKSVRYLSDYQYTKTWFFDNDWNLYIPDLVIKSLKRIVDKLENRTSKNS